MAKTSAYNGGFLFRPFRSTMNKTILVGAVAAFVCGAVYWAYYSAGPSLPIVAANSTGDSTPAKLHTVSSGRTLSNDSGHSLSVNEAAELRLSTISDASGKQHILDSIQLASISYDPVELPRIQPYLTHSDPEVREAALNGIVVLGHAAGAPLLRNAASRITNPIEAAELLKKADYLELPSVPIKLLRQKLKRQPNERQSQTGNMSP